jgi:AraC-like DNA-binding protein
MDTGFSAQQLYSACRVIATHHYPEDGVECSPPLSGTGFLVEFPTGDSRLGLVTNRHIADAVFNDANEYAGTAIKSIELQWWQSSVLRLQHVIEKPMPLYHSDPLIDAAVVPITSEPDAPIDITGELYDDVEIFISDNSDEKLVFNHALSWEHLLECETLWPLLEPGEFVAFPGYPVWYDRLQIRPVMRSGTIASDPQTDYRSDEGEATAKDSSHQVLFDAYSTSGNSGSPVYVAQRGFPPMEFEMPIGDGKTGVRTQLGFRGYHRSFLIGINASHYNDTGILRHNEHAGLSRMHKLSVIMDILRANQTPHGPESRVIRVAVPVPAGSRRKATKAARVRRDEIIRHLRREGKSLKAIAAEVGCSASTVGRVVRKDVGTS